MMRRFRITFHFISLLLCMCVRMFHGLVIENCVRNRSLNFFGMVILLPMQKETRTQMVLAMKQNFNHSHSLSRSLFIWPKISMLFISFLFVLCSKQCSLMVLNPFENEKKDAVFVHPVRCCCFNKITQPRDSQPFLIA